MKIISWNVNGIRAAIRYGFFEWFEKESPEILCIQEIKIGDDKLTFDLLYPAGYSAFFNSAIRPGYSGVAVFSKKKPRSVSKLLGMDRFESEGRILQLQFADFKLYNLYIPHGGRDKRNMNYKLAVYNILLDRLKKEGINKTILVGDFNVAHSEVDLARPKNNINNTMFTFPERVQINKLLDLGFIDSFRKFHKYGGFYSWWPYRRGLREKNIGWRIDYCFVSKDMEKKIGESYILDSIKGSDHCPVGIEMKL